MSSSRKSNTRNRGGRGSSRGGGGRRGGRQRDNTRSSDAMRDEDVLIAFAPFVRNEDSEALRIQTEFQSSNDQRAFVRAARQFLQKQKNAPTKEEAKKDMPKMETVEQVESKPSPARSQPAQQPQDHAVEEPSMPQADSLPSNLTDKMHAMSVKEEPSVSILQQTPPRQDKSNTPPPPGLASPVATTATPTPPPGNWIPAPPGLTSLSTPQPESLPDTPVPETPTTVEPQKPKFQPKRKWMSKEQQPGRILANNASFGQVIQISPRKKFDATWTLPLSYLRGYAPKASSIHEAIRHLSVGLFRRGSADNSTSIITKEILAPEGESRKDYPFTVDKRTDCVVGTIPFYSPRTPGNVVLRLYWQNNELYTLATGPTLSVQVTARDLEPTLSFILSNFKTKKGSSTSLSSLHSFATVLEDLDIPSNRRFETAGNATWGCLCESRKVLSACAREYAKTREKLKKLDAEVEELKAKEEEAKEEKDDEEQAPSATEEKRREKMGALMSGRASNERKWRDAQVAFSCILKAFATNASCQILLNRELIVKIRLEFELWCPLCQSFALSPFNTDKEALVVNPDEIPQPINAKHFEKCLASRAQMQMDTLGFVPSTLSLEQVLFPNQRKSQPQSMNPVAVETFNGLSASMTQLYQQEYMVSERIHQQRELVRAHIEKFVSQCDAFPAGTKVVVFGSAANGFGSPSSDLDTCLQLPPNVKLQDADDPTGAKAMAKLAEVFEAGGMKEVNIDRLSARIPIIKFMCPRPMASADEEPLMECDLSMQNSLACLNTSLLLTYSQIHPLTRVLASIVKRWAKSRDINTPSNHTLSTYGYTLMLLHFLTYHRRAGSGLVTTIDKIVGGTWVPLLPNLQWMDARFPESPPHTPYTEYSYESQPKNLMVHPMLDDNEVVVNTYFFRLQNSATLQSMQRRFPGQDLSLSILLASFFRYYAYEFDYKAHVVSLASRANGGLVEREVKAETDGWRVFGWGLSIEDPFETFYDVAHVVKGKFPRIRNEFAIAYSKIVHAATGRPWGDKDTSNMSGSDLIDWICEVVEQPSESTSS